MGYSPLPICREQGVIPRCAGESTLLIFGRSKNITDRLEMQAFSWHFVLYIHNLINPAVNTRNTGRYISRYVPAMSALKYLIVRSKQR